MAVAKMLTLSFNRTTMELKQVLSEFVRLLARLLIEPLWNWNAKVVPFWIGQRITFNRTTMELKLGYFSFFPSSRRAFNRTTMELKLECLIVEHNHTYRLLIEPLWNWNLVPVRYTRGAQIAFNRTTMELKHSPSFLPSSFMNAFNRTTMELKRYFTAQCANAEVTFNRTTMELKLVLKLMALWIFAPFNRTTMELKLHFGCSPFSIHAGF